MIINDLLKFRISQTDLESNSHDFKLVRVIILNFKRYSYELCYLDAQLYAVIFLAQNCLVKFQQRVVTTSWIYFFTMPQIHDMGRTRTHWIVDQRVDKTSFLSSERILTIFSRPYKQKRSTPFKRTAFTRGAYKYLRYFACEKTVSTKGNY